MRRTQTSHWLRVSVIGSLTLVGCSQSSSQQVASHLVRERPATVAMTQPTPSPMPPTRVDHPRTLTPAVASAPVLAPAQPTTPSVPDYAMPAYANMPSHQGPTATTAQGDAEIQPVSYQEESWQASPSPAAKGAFPRGETVSVRRSLVDVTASACCAHAKDYSWLCGQVEYSRLSNGWRLRFASVDETDPYGGSVILSGDSSLNTMKDGQYIRVQGHLCNPDETKIAPPYRVDSFEAINPSN